MTRLLLTACAAASLMALAACHQEGPAQKAGQSLDNAGQKIQDTISPPGPAESAGRKVDKALGN
jgi:predicted small lipoprotein YifL